MEREQRSEGLLRDFIRANCQRMKHELAKRDCGLGQYRRDPGAAAAVILLQLHSKCVKRTHTISHTHTTTRRPPAHWHTQCHNWPAKSGWDWWLKTTAARGGERKSPPLWILPSDQAWKSESSQQKACVCLFVRVPPSLHVCLTAFIFHIGQYIKSNALFFFLIVSHTHSPTILRT